jgi:hypothetical protein
MLAPHGIIVGRDDREFVAEVAALYDDLVDPDVVADMVLLSSLPPDERWRVEQHRRRLERDGD